MKVGEVAASATGDENLLAGAVGSFEDRDTAATLAGLDGAEQARGASSEDYGVKGLHQERCLLQKRGWRVPVSILPLKLGKGKRRGGRRLWAGVPRSNLR
jgi:hypothetical protein